jgi:uncharacterized protein (AIM24 family)
MEYWIHGENLQVVNFKLGPGEEVYAEASRMVYKTANVTMKSRKRASRSGGLRGERAHSLITIHYRTDSGNGVVGFAGALPGRIVTLPLAAGQLFYVLRDAFLCAESSIDISIAPQKEISKELRGHEGGVLERLDGPGLICIHAIGDYLDFDLGEGERIQVDPGCLIGFDETITHRTEPGAGEKRGQQAASPLISLIGPGTAILQTLRMDRFRRELGK